jgi:hypothetical protein
MKKPSLWARWKWQDSGIGRWHVLAATNGAAVLLACGRVRSLPTEVAPRPTNEKCCSTCRKFDDMRLGYKAETADDLIGSVVEAPSTPELAPVSVDLTPPPGICTCGCDKSNAGLEWKRRAEAEKERVRAEALAGWNAYLAARGIQQETS